MSTLIIKPNFDKLGNALTIPAKSINLFMETEINDNLDFYQRQFGIYSYMKLTKFQKFVLHTVSGNPLMWQPDRACSFDPTGNLRTGRREVEPCNAKLNSELCYDELFDSCFEPFLTWSSNSPIRLDAQGEEFLNRLIKVLAVNAALGARMTLTAGKLYDPSLVTFNNNVTKEIKDLFTLTAGTCKGWIELLKELGENAETRNCNFKDIFTEDDFDGAKFVGSPISLYDALLDRATPELMTVMNEGGTAIAVDGSAVPVMLVSNSIHMKIANDYRQQCLSVMCTNPRLTKKEYNVPGRGGSTRPTSVYFIDDTPVIPITDTTQYTKYLTGDTHFAVLTVSGNIALGSSFSELPNINQPNVGIRIERLTSNKDWGKYSFLAHALFATQISDSAYVSATQIYAEKA